MISTYAVVAFWLYVCGVVCCGLDEKLLMSESVQVSKNKKPHETTVNIAFKMLFRGVFCSIKLFSLCRNIRQPSGFFALSL